MMQAYFSGGDPSQDYDQPQTFFTERSFKIYEHYLDYLLEDFAVARQLCTLLRGVEENDTVVIRINSPGGRFDVAAQIMNAINECAGTVVGVIEQECASSATMIFLSCQQWQVQPWGEMMIHNASYGAVGKSHEVSARVRSAESQMAQVVETIYKDFLTEDEIQEVIKGMDIYLTSDEIVSRLEFLVEKQQEETENDDEPESEPKSKKSKKTDKRS